MPYYQQYLAVCVLFWLLAPAAVGHKSQGAMAGDLALYALRDQNEQQLAAALALGVIPGGKLAGKLFKSMGGMASRAFKASAQIAMAGGSKLLHKAGGMAGKGANWVARKAQRAVGKGSCGCFTAAILVWTAQGMVPIHEIEQGQYVYAAQEDARASDYAQGEVGATIYIGEASLVRLMVRHQDGSVEIIDTTDEHPFHPVHTGEWTRADRLQVGDHLSTMAGTAELLAVEYGTERVPVYNLSIPGSPTYFVGTHGLWVHNCIKHHLFPAYRGNPHKRAFFESSGINPDGFTVKLDPGYHKKVVHPGWNKDWDLFMEMNPDATRNQIHDWMEHLAGKYGIDITNIEHYGRLTR